MPAPKLPQKEVEQKLRLGWGARRIQEWLLGAPHFVEVTPESINMFAKRRGIVIGDGNRYENLLPWAVARQHRNLYSAKLLRREGQRRSGRKLSAKDEAELDRWINKLKADDLVVAYSRDTERGWWYVPKRPGIDEDLIRVPGLDEDD